ncbi:abortive infection protein [Agrobacterium albertimagni AOL15]|uniref:Abortive infection protein n=1 Tax=Agrobacterium albertimagni AOL15 TaxID=1156935 RepID=K2Q8Z5_9HYPH|nr:CPBP family intramembrane glutamic endopeptidase [Agrobacterium albertimagni]EKF61655.1 abortive infection protein [Agrobacterium albertimagni AOL15]
MTHDAEHGFSQSKAAAPHGYLPTEVEYHRAFAGPERRILRGLTVILLLFGGLIGFANLGLAGASFIDASILGRSGFTPLAHAATSLALALLIPYSMLLQRVFYGLPTGSLHSVTGCFRFDMFGRSLLVIGPLVLIPMSLTSLFMPGDTITWSHMDIVAFFITGMILTPLAAAGEEYGFRGLMFRIVGSWTLGPLSGAILGIILTAGLFSLFHGSSDPYLLTSYLVLFSSLAVITWRTGGLEVAVVIHGVYNVSGLVLATALHVDIGGALAGRSEIVGVPANLLPGLVVGAIAILFVAATWKDGPLRTDRQR